jgi:hypothetical protein
MAFDSAFPNFVRAPDAAEGRAAIEAIVEAGARLLIDEPWRVGRIIRGADGMTLRQLADEATRRRALAPPTDFNRALALAQLNRALEAPRFALAWSERRGACAK